MHILQQLLQTRDQRGRHLLRCRKEGKKKSPGCVIEEIILVD
jgi:hypothetical protein